ncbi:MAG: T9SS type A sorting domain-containing protein, partial [Bacteroidales bacterium]|nr:T9SS type A sorting domain-containing protein [Bacteroidales bacterium]
DVNGNSASNTAIVTVEDNINPTVLTQNITVQLDATGNASITTADIDNGSFDNCSIATMTLDITAFDCSNVGENTVMLTVVDVNGNSASNTAIVTVEDNINPNVLTQNITVQLDATGNASITTADIDNDSFDNCGIATMTLDVTAFDCSNMGENTVMLTVVDVNGNSASNTAIVTVEDNINPTVLTQNITVQLDATGNASITTADIDNGSFDNCGIATMTLNITAFDCSYVGENTVTLTVVDVNGNSASNTAIVTVEDNINPTVLTQNITVQLDATGNASITTADINNGSFDNCGIATMTLDVTAFDCSNVGENTVTLTVVDINGNSASNTAIITVEDNETPVIINPGDQELVNGSQCEGILADFIEGLEYYDNCGIQSITQTPEAGTLFDLNTGIVPVTILATDINGNSSSVTFNVNIHDEYNFEITGVEKGNITTCNTWPDGHIIINTTLDSSLLHYSIYNNAWQGYNNHFEGLQAGSYNIRVKNLNGCIKEWAEPVTILPPTGIILENLIATESVYCYGGTTGNIEIKASGGSGQFFYSIDNGNNWQEENIFNNLPAGNYQIQITDESGCSYIHDEEIIIEQADPLEFTNIIVNDVEGCFGNANGSISIAKAGGTGLIAFSINNGIDWSGQDTFNNLPAGTYNLALKDANGCEKYYGNNPVIITQPEILIVTEVTTNNTSCNEADNGTIMISHSGGIGSIEYSLDNGQNWNTDNIITDLAPGSYNISIKDANGCDAFYENNPVTITQPTQLEITTVEMGDIFCNQSTISLNIEAVGGTGNIEYSANNGNTWYASGEFTMNSGGIYNVSVRDENGCEVIYNNNPLSFDAIYSSDIDIEVSPENEVCEGETITLTAITDDDVSFSWNAGANFNSILNVTEEIGTYEFTVTAINQYNCTSHSSVEITFTDCTGVSDIDESAIVLFPNPNTGEFSLEFNSNTLPEAIRIYNTQGKLVFEQKSKELITNLMTINLPNLSPGVYYTQIEFESKLVIKKMVIKE